MIAIASICLSPGKSEYREPYHYNRQPVEEARLIAGHGIEGDHKAGHPKRQLNLMCRETLDEMAREGFRTGPGQMGEQLVLSGVRVDGLAAGTILRLGPEAQVEVLGPRTGCDWFQTIQQKSLAEAGDRMGVMARVVQGGLIHVGDPVALVEAGVKGPG